MSIDERDVPTAIVIAIGKFQLSFNLCFSLPQHFVKRVLGIDSSGLAASQFPAFSIFANQILVRFRQVRDFHAGRVKEQSPATQTQ